MHEMAIADHLYQQVAAIAEARKITIREIEVEIGALQLVASEALQAAWEAIRMGTALEGAALKLTETQATARCRQCGSVFEAEMRWFLCPDCGQADVELLSGNDIILKSLTGDAEAESAGAAPAQPPSEDKSPTQPSNLEE